MTKPGAPAVAAVDWGTSSLRVWLLDRGGAALAERRSGEGMQTARTAGFPTVLERMLSELAAPADLPAIVCGMAGARQGWIEAPYADVPCALDEIFSRAIDAPDAPRRVRIIPGLAQRVKEAPDVMRGEETQIAGAVRSLGAGRHIVCMPGTHSKWVAVDGGSVTGFTTWMTGELFDVFARHSILAHSIGDSVKGISADDDAFMTGLEQGLEGADRVSSLTFGIRAATLLQGLQPKDAAARLSGLLVGAEIAGAERRYLGSDNEVILVASGALGTLYAAALKKAGLAIKTVDADEAVRAGLVQAARMNGMLPERA
ncbi:2-dehydro-3-deoxygalactonokinase [Arvimicrobium flavum]|uniref:2-dehydro-3-deoxygalactonokinase n=1 Tax=Arvimicrobium flavum TaxID=3393320 RepID=UPI00237AFF85|nr:2-dehydro-3-deoxygalactonokinase [Mesorhizobium shangrilense]